MIPKLLVLLVLGVMLREASTEGCSIEVLSKTDNLCEVKLFCSETTYNMENIVDANCKREQIRRYDYEYNYHYRQSIASQREKVLHVIFDNMFVNNTEDPLKDIVPYKTTVRDLVIKNGNIISFPSQIYSMNTITEISVTNNALDVINFDKLSMLNNLRNINASHNSISIIAKEKFAVLRTSAIEKIDLSYNLITEIPINGFVNCHKLLHLDLSHNLLKSLDILSFEGLHDLQVLDLSNNQLSELGVSLARFVNLKKISLNNNQLTTVSNLNFRTLSNLKSLYLSYNLLKNLDDDTFSHLIKLENIDLSYNKMSVIRNNLFEFNENLNIVQLDGNILETIDRGTFKNKNVTHFYFNNNTLTGSIENDTFIGITTTKLDLSGERITSLGLQAFSCLGHHLEILNLSRNMINHISKSAFSGLKNLIKLDLSRNLLIDLDFETSDLKQVVEIDLSNNRIKYLKNYIFTNMFAVKKIDVSFNEIENVEIGSFFNLEHVENIILNNNPMEKSLDSNVFRNLSSLLRLHITNTRILSFENNSLSDLPNLKFLNSSFGRLISLGYETFKNSAAIEILDFSYNEIEIFMLNTSNTPFLKELYLNNNKIMNITCAALVNLLELKKIDLSFNNILQIDSSTFQTTKQINTINLSMNTNLTIDGGILNNLELLSQVDFARTNKVHFENVSNVSIATLNLSYCNINDLNEVYIFNVKDILRLDLSSNKIISLNRKSFKVMSDLNWIELSSNNISLIEPGTFRYTSSINILDLHKNQLVFLQFGVLDGLSNLRILNLSQNAIINFDSNLLHATPFISNLILDSNKITSIHLDDFNGHNLKTLSIGNNPLKCHDIIIHLGRLEFNVTAEIRNYHQENINGITCITSNVSVSNDRNNDIYENLTMYNVQYHEKLLKILDSLLNETSSSALINTVQNEISNLTHTFTNILNSSEISMTKNLNVLYNISDGTSKINKLRDLFTEHVNNEKVDRENNNKIMKSMLDKIGNYKKEIIGDSPEKNYKNNEDASTENIKDIKYLLYILTGIISTIVILQSVKAVYVFYRPKRVCRAEILPMH